MYTLACHTHRKRGRPSTQPSQCFVVVAADMKTSSYKQKNEKGKQSHTHSSSLHVQHLGQDEGVGLSSKMLPATRLGRIQASCLCHHSVWKVSVQSVQTSYSEFQTSMLLDNPQYSLMWYQESTAVLVKCLQEQLLASLQES